MCLGALAVLLPLSSQAESLPLHLLNLPPGFSITVFAHVPNARQMTRSPGGIVYVGSRGAGKVHAVIDRDGDFIADDVVLVDDGLNLPSGVTMRANDLYVGAVDRILRYADIDSQYSTSPDPEVVIDTLPDKRHHGWKFIEFGPDGYLYIPVGAPCNLCLSENPVFASISRIKLDSKPARIEVFASGVRNSVGFDWHPLTGELWFTDNGRDMMGDDIPPGELNHAPSPAMHFGYPFFHANSLTDPEFGAGRQSSAYFEPALALGPHVAPLGMMFYTGKSFPAAYMNQIIIAEHGSWNRSPQAGHTGYRLTLALQQSNGSLRYATFIDGWLQDNVAWGRPVDVLQLPDGSILVSDDHASVIYRVSYNGGNTN